MPSWNIHIAHVERLLAERRTDELGIADANAFLFGNFAPDIYVGFMVPDATFRIDYCLTHNAVPHSTPTPDANRFWDECVSHPLRRATTPAGTSLVLGAWAHLVADRTYNARFRALCEARSLQPGDELRQRKQADFELFGRSLDVSSRVQATPELLEAARTFRPYSIAPQDVMRAVDVANSIADGSSPRPGEETYRLLDAKWMAGSFEACHVHLVSWLEARAELERAGAPTTAADIAHVVGAVDAIDGEDERPCATLRPEMR